MILGHKNEMILKMFCIQSTKIAIQLKPMECTRSWKPGSRAVKIRKSSTIEGSSTIERSSKWIDFRNARMFEMEKSSN